MMRQLCKIILIVTFSCSLPTFAQLHFTLRPAVKKYIQTLHQKYHFDQKKLIALFKQVKIRHQVVKHIKHPYEAKPWFKYRAHFITPHRIQRGVAFWQKHKKVLARAKKDYHIPPKIIVAILGVESNYGKHTGKFRVINALSTLAFNYSKREKFFKKELTEFLLLCREKHIKPLTVYGSYAGAIGQPQFMPSSFRAYAIDFDHNGHIDLSHNMTDIIGSIANYLGENGWQPEDKKIAMKINVQNHSHKIFPKISDPANKILSQLKKYGVFSKNPLSLNKTNTLIKLKNKKGMEYWLGFHNFYVITKYNSSINYAMAIHQLAEAIEKSYHKKQKKQKVHQHISHHASQTKTTTR